MKLYVITIETAQEFTPWSEWRIYAVFVSKDKAVACLTQLRQDIQNSNCWYSDVELSEQEEGELAV